MKKVVTTSTSLTKLSLLACVCGLAFATTAFADDSTTSDPWFTGTLLASSGATIPKGHLNVEPYLFYTDDYGFYNSLWKNTHVPVATSLTPTLFITYGLTDWMDIGAVVPYTFNHQSGQSAQGFGDSAVVFGFQALNDKPGTLMPNLRVTLQETFPTGEFQHLDGSKGGVDATGAGAYQTALGANFAKLFYPISGHALKTHLTFNYTLPSSVNVSGYNAYGGSANTNGRMRLGSVFATDLGFEYQLTQNWVPALDVVYTVSQASSFSGFAGTTSTGTPISMGVPSGEVLSLAPAMEYNFNEHIGIIAGPWFSVTGRNKSDFVAGVVGINIYY